MAGTPTRIARPGVTWASSQGLPLSVAWRTAPDRSPSRKGMKYSNNGRIASAALGGMHTTINISVASPARTVGPDDRTLRRSGVSSNNVERRCSVSSADGRRGRLESNSVQVRSFGWFVPLCPGCAPVLRPALLPGVKVAWGRHGDHSPASASAQCQVRRIAYGRRIVGRCGSARDDSAGIASGARFSIDANRRSMT